MICGSPGRRMDAILRQFEAFLPLGHRAHPPDHQESHACAWATRATSMLLCSSWNEFNGKLSENDRANLLPLQEHLRGERSIARAARCWPSLDSSGVQKDFDKLRATLAHPASLLEAQPRSPLVTLSELIRSRYKKVRKAADRLTADSSMDEYHAVRGRVKKLRYALETVAVAVRKTCGRNGEALRRWQEKLGAQQDADVAGRRLRALAMQTRPRDCRPKPCS